MMSPLLDLSVVTASVEGNLREERIIDDDSSSNLAIDQRGSSLELKENVMLMHHYTSKIVGLVQY